MKLKEDEEKKNWDKLFDKMKEMEMSQGEIDSIKEEILHNEAEFHRKK